MLSIFNGLNESIIVSDINFRITYVNSRTTKLFELEESELINKNIFEILNEEKLKNVITSDNQPVDIISKTINNKIFYLEISFSELNADNDRLFVFILRDYSKSNEIKRQRDKNEKRLDQIQKISGVGLWEHELVNDILYWSDEVYKIFEKDKSSFTPNYNSFLESIHPDDREKVNKAYIDSLQNKQKYSIDHRVLLDNRKLKYVHEECFNEYDNDGRILRTIGTVQDVSEFIKVQSALKETEIKFRNVFEQASIGICYSDTHGKFINTNRKFLEIIGYSFDELYSLTWREITYSDDIYLDENLVKSALNGEISTYNLEKRYIHKNSSIIWVNLTVSLIYDESGNPLLFVGFIEDISERKRTELRLFENQRKFSSFINATNYYIILLNQNLEITEINDEAAIKLFNITDKSKVEGKYIKDVLPNFDREVFDKFDNIIDKSEIIYKEVEWNLSEYKKVFLSVDAFPSGSDIGIIMSDISEQKQNEIIQTIQSNITKALFQKMTLTEFYQTIQEELSKLINTKNFYIAFYDEKTDLLSAPFEKDEKESLIKWPAAKSLTGLVVYKGESVLLKKSEIEELFKIGEIELFGARAESWLGVPLKIDGKTIGAIAVQSYDDPEAYNNASKSILEVIAGQLSILINKKIIEENTAKLLKGIEHSPLSIVITNLDGNIEYVNPKFCEVSGYSPDELVGHNPRILKSGYQDNSFYTEMWKTIISGKDWQGEIQNKKKNGELYWENSNISPIFNEDGKIQHFIGIKEDITEKKQLMTELIKAKEKAEESDRLKSAFLANVSHEIRTPMNAILGFSKLLDDPDMEYDERKECIDIIEKKGNDLLKLINDILDLSKIESNQLPLNFTTNNINPLFFELQATFSKEIQFSEYHDKTNVQLRIGRTLPDDFQFKSDFSRINQILINLISNALKFTRSGYVEFGCYLEDKNSVVFYVKDTGIGIPRDKHNRIFERFQQLEENFQTRNFGGAGLGLSIVKGLVELLKGKIWLESEINKGSTFYFSIPYLTDRQEIASEIIEEVKFFNKNNILVVEDELTNFLFLSRILKKELNAEIIHAVNRAEAVEYTRIKEDISLILMDIKMPVMSGIEAFIEIRKFNISVPIIALTAYAMNEEKDRIMDMGFNDYISKPYTKEILLNTLKKYILD